MSEEIHLLEHDKYKYDAARETDIYNREVRLSVDKKSDSERIERMQDIIEVQKRKIENRDQEI